MLVNGFEVVGRPQQTDIGHDHPVADVVERLPVDDLRDGGQPMRVRTYWP